MGSFLAFLGISVLVIVTPGPDTAVTVRNTLLGGRAGGIFTALGIATGQAIWALATSIGIVALLVASEPLFVALKLAGAAYLVFLGGQALWSAWRGTEPAAVDISGPRRLADHLCRRDRAHRHGAAAAEDTPDDRNRDGHGAHRPRPAPRGGAAVERWPQHHNPSPQRGEGGAHARQRVGG